MGQTLPLAEAVQPAREGLAREELRQKKNIYIYIYMYVCSNSHGILHILVIKSLHAC